MWKHNIQKNEEIPRENNPHTTTNHDLLEGPT